MVECEVWLVFRRIVKVFTFHLINVCHGHIGVRGCAWFRILLQGSSHCWWCWWWWDVEDAEDPDVIEQWTLMNLSRALGPETEGEWGGEGAGLSNVFIPWARADTSPHQYHCCLADG